MAETSQEGSGVCWESPRAGGMDSVQEDKKAFQAEDSKWEDKAKKPG